MESIESFRRRFRKDLAPSLPPRDAAPAGETSRARSDRHRELQALIYRKGFAGIRYPEQYGGLGLTPSHQEAFNEEAAGYELPRTFAITLGILGAVLLDFGTERQKQSWIPAMLRGQSYWVQLLSEPSGGSDMSAATSRATRDGDTYVVSGAKTWTSNAHFSDWGMALVRTDWSLPKRKGLSVIAIPLTAAGVTVRPILMANNDDRFCEEFFDDVVLPADYLIGAENDGWNVASRLLIHQRSMVGRHGLDGGLQEPAGTTSLDQRDPIVELAHAVGRAADPLVRQLAAEAYVDSLALRGAGDRIATAVASGHLPPAAAAIPKLLRGMTWYRRAQIALQVAGEDALTLGGRHSVVGSEWLVGRANSLGGGTNEIQRNMIAERVMGLPREAAEDSSVPFKDAVRNRDTRAT